jgi:hypothetical protein
MKVDLARLRSLERELAYADAHGRALSDLRDEAHRDRQRAATAAADALRQAIASRQLPEHTTLADVAAMTADQRKAAGLPERHFAPLADALAALAEIEAKQKAHTAIVAPLRRLVIECRKFAGEGHGLQIGGA